MVGQLNGKLIVNCFCFVGLALSQFICLPIFNHTALRIRLVYLERRKYQQARGDAHFARSSLNQYKHDVRQIANTDKILKTNMFDVKK